MQNFYFKIKILFITIIVGAFCWSGLLSAFELEIKYFDVQGLRLNMTLDRVKTTFNINTIRAIQDEYGTPSEYEIIKRIGKKTLSLRFTGEKRLYRIEYINIYKSFVNRSSEILEQLVVKYGEPNWKYHPTQDSKPLDIFACWGMHCSKETYAPLDPTLIANIYYRSGKVKLILANHSIFNEDWEMYKTKRQGSQQQKIESETKQSENLEF